VILDSADMAATRLIRHVSSPILVANGLTAAQSRVVELVLQGRSTPSIVEEVYISANTPAGTSPRSVRQTRDRQPTRTCNVPYRRASLIGLGGDCGVRIDARILPGVDGESRRGTDSAFSIDQSAT